MSALDWILGSEALAATGTACVAIWLGTVAAEGARKAHAAARMWRKVAISAARMLESEREANFLHTHLHRPRASADAQETTQPG